MNLSLLKNDFENRQSELSEDWMTFLRFPSISTDPANRKDCTACVEWLAERLRRSRFDVQVVPTTANPFLFAERLISTDVPTVLVYGHYDVQPVDPVDAWTSPPFEPEWRDGRLYARGAQDNKGQVFYTLAAIETLIASGELNLNLKILIEGDEECGSTGLGAELQSWQSRLHADVLMVPDVLTVASGDPTIIMGLRGIVNLNLELHGADHDLHSGIHGGVAPNPAQGVAQLTASLFAQDGQVAVPGFYDGVEPPSPLERELAEAVSFDTDAWLAQIGTTPDGGMRKLPPYERIGFQPSLDVNGIHSGYGGSGMKTVIPSAAQLKLTARLVPGQDPEKILDAISTHMFRHAPPGLRLTISDRGIGGPGFRLNPRSDGISKAKNALREVIPDKPVVFLWEGASIPIISRLADVAGADPLLVGFGHETDCIHAPNESFSMAQFKSGFLYTALMLQLFQPDCSNVLSQ